MADNEEDFGGYKIINTKTNVVKKFNNNGLLIKIERTPQDILTLSYSGDNVLDKVTNIEGAFIQFGYQTVNTNSIYSRATTVFNYPVSVTNEREESSLISWEHTHMGKTAIFSFITKITEVTQGDPVTARSYAYNDSRFPVSLTDMYLVPDVSLDEQTLIYHFEYNEKGQAIKSERADGQEGYTVEYVSDSERKITNSLGKISTYLYSNTTGVNRLQKVIGEPTSNCLSSAVEYEYDDNGNVETKIQNDRITSYQYDSLNRETSRTEAYNTPQARTIQTEWHDTLSLKTKVIEPERTTVYTYDDQGRLTNTQIQSNN